MTDEKFIHLMGYGVVALALVILALLVWGTPTHVSLT